MRRWSDDQIFEADPKPRIKKLFVTVPYPYMSGPLHVGTAYTILRADVYARFKRMQGYNVLFPYAWHWTGEPIAGIAERVKKKDPILLRVLREVDKVPEDEISKFLDPKYVAEYYTRDGRLALPKLGVSIDWRREFHTTSRNPHYSQFVTWQYTRLREKGYVTLGTHPVVWCPHDKSPTGDHDRDVGEGVSPEEYTLIKFQMDGVYLPCATFRPETIFGATNVWVNPDAEYERIRIDGKEEWIVSHEAAFKLSEQLRKVEMLSRLKGSELIGKSVREGINKRDLPILPAPFVDSKTGTGLVYSVPAHAPYDWLALRDLQSNQSAQVRYGLEAGELKAIKPISLIQVEGYGEFPALETVDRMKITSQTDPHADDATNQVYKKEFHTGIMKPITGKYSGLRISEAKEKVIQDLKEAGIADTLWDLPEPVVCRCTTRCIVKILENQWFLRYSDPKWKAKVKQLIDHAKFYPPEVKKSFEYTVDWLHDHACTRHGGMGTPLPWDPTWIIETLSDSTIYMSYYIISKYVNAGQIKPEQLSLKFFEYVFSGKGSGAELGRETGLDLKLIHQIRRDFAYWYPVDLRNSAKELVPNHLTYFLFHHTALFPRKHWPRGVGVNGFVSIDGQPMHKSKGIFVTLKDALREYGADAVRAALMSTTEGLDDPDWRNKAAEEAVRTIKSLAAFVSENLPRPDMGEGKHYMDSWLMSRLQKHITDTTKALEALKTRTAFYNACYTVWNDLRWYLHRVKTPNRATLRYALGVWLRLLTPFTPYVCEELWAETGERQFISNEEWPVANETLIDKRSEFEEEYRQRVLGDSKAIMKLLRTTPTSAHYYTAPDWKWEILRSILEEKGREMLDQGRLMERLMQKPENRKRGAELAKNAAALIDAARDLSPEWREAVMKNRVDEVHIILEAKDFFEKELGIPIAVHRSEYASFDPTHRSGRAIPLKPAIFLETAQTQLSQE